MGFIVHPTHNSGNATVAAMTDGPDGGSSPAASGLDLDSSDGDAWSWTAHVTGSCRGLDPETEIDVLVGDRRWPARRSANSFEVTVALEPGPNSIYAVARHGATSSRSRTIVRTGRLSPRPTARIAATVTDRTFALDGSPSIASALEGAPIVSWDWTMTSTAPANPTVIQAAAGRNTAMLAPKDDGQYRIALSVQDERGRSDTGAILISVTDGAPRVVDPMRERPDWMGGSTIYGAVPRNVSDYGFQGIIERLDDLAGLGIAAIWLAPITESPAGDFGYAVVDYFQVRAAYGTAADFKRLVAEAHRRNIRVLLDVVPNHTSAKHPYFLDSEENGAKSPYHWFYDRDDQGSYSHYFGWKHLPNLDFDNPDVHRLVTEALMYWVREFDVDGFRIDVAWGIRQRRPDFWPAFCEEFYRVKPDGLLIAEASARDPYYVDNGFGAAYDWTSKLGGWAWTEAFSREPINLAALRQSLMTEPGAAGSTFRFLNNNDTGRRFVSVHGLDIYRVALAMLLTLPGLPCLYLGDEVGAEFEPYDWPGPIDWADRAGLRPFVRKLIELRRTVPALRQNDWTLLDAEPGEAIMAYVRGGTDGVAPLLVLLNFSPRAVEATVPAQQLRPFASEHPCWIDVMGDADLPGYGAALALTMPASGIRMLMVDQSGKLAGSRERTP